MVVNGLLLLASNIQSNDNLMMTPYVAGGLLIATRPFYPCACVSEYI